MSQTKRLVAVAGATGRLGQLITHYLLDEGTIVRALVRPGSNKKIFAGITQGRIDIVEVDYSDPASLACACTDVDCVVSALSGLREVIVDAQTNILNAAIRAHVKRFIPSDFCIDYRPLPPGRNRNLDFRREFSKILDRANIHATSVLNGMFTDLLVDQAPVILKKQKKIFFWGNADQEMDFTTMNDTARFTALVALDESAPRWLCIAGDVVSMRDIQIIASNTFGRHFGMLRPGGLGAFKIVISLTKAFSPGKHETFPTWQGMQYMYDMLSGLPKFQHLDNRRYNKIRWTKIETVIGPNSLPPPSLEQ